MRNKIINIILGAMIVLSLGAAYQNASVEKDLPSLYEEHRLSVVRLVASEPSTKSFIGASGFVVDAKKGYIFTAGHFAKPDRTLILIGEKKSAVLKRIKVDRENECAIYQVDPLFLKGMKEVKFSIDAQVGDTVFSIGHPLSISNATSVGIISKEVTSLPPLFGMGVYVTDSKISNGSSGCPVFNLKGEVVGCAVGYIDGWGLILPAQTIVDFINGIN